MRRIFGGNTGRTPFIEAFGHFCCLLVSRWLPSISFGIRDFFQEICAMMTVTSLLQHPSLGCKNVFLSRIATPARPQAIMSSKLHLVDILPAFNNVQVIQRRYISWLLVLLCSVFSLLGYVWYLTFKERTRSRLRGFIFLALLVIDSTYLLGYLKKIYLTTYLSFNLGNWKQSDAEILRKDSE